MLVIRRKNLMIGLLVVLLIVMGYLNFVYNQNSAPTVNPEKENPAAENDAVDGKITISDLEDPAEPADEEKDSATDTEDTEDTDSTETMAAGSTSFFRDYRFEREQDRGKEIGYINSIVENPNSDPEMVKEAQAQLLEITSSMESELAIENLIKAKGFPDVAVILHNDNVNVIVDKAELVPEEVAMVLDIVKRESGKEAGNIKIIPKIETGD